MKITLRNPLVVRLLAVGSLIAVIGLAGCSSTGSRTAGQKWSDHGITKDVKSSLDDDPVFKYPEVVVNVYEGNIQLSGFATYPEQRYRAAENAAHVKGARQVINNIMLKPTPTGPVTIRDPLGHETGRLMVDPNSPPPTLRNFTPSSGAPVKNVQPTTPPTTPESTNPK
jgi:hyperosmotically inducible protein